MGTVLGRISVEQPTYKEVAHNLGAGAQLRQYGRQCRARVALASGGRSAQFRTLANYIGAFGTPKNSGGRAVAMTAPVVSQPPQAIAMTAPVISGGGAAMEFVLPEEISIETAPKPTDPSVELVDVPPRLVGVLSFSGSADLETVDGKADAFVQRLLEAGFKPKDEANPWQLAQYNPPYTLPCLRSNEIWCEVTSNA